MMLKEGRVRTICCLWSSYEANIIILERCEEEEGRGRNIPRVVNAIERQRRYNIVPSSWCSSVRIGWEVVSIIDVLCVLLGDTMKVGITQAGRVELHDEMI